MKYSIDIKACLLAGALFLLTTLFFISCSEGRPRTHQRSPGEIAASEAAEEQDKQRRTHDTVKGISTELLVKYFSGNLHNGNRFPCVVVNTKENKVLVSGKGVFAKLPASELKQAWKEYMVAFDNAGFFEKNPLLKGKKPVIIDGKEYYSMTMDELMPKLTPGERAMYTAGQLEALYHTRISDGYGVLLARGFQVIYANSKEFFIVTANGEEKIPLEKKDSCFKVFKKRIEGG